VRESIKNGEGGQRTREGLWMFLFPTLLLLSAVAATWSVHVASGNYEERQTQALEERMQRAAQSMVPDLTLALQEGDTARLHLMIKDLGRISGGQARVYDREQELLADSGPRLIEPDREDEDAPVMGSVDRSPGEILYWQPIRDASGKRIGELRFLHARPAAMAFDWPLWGRIFSLFMLASLGMLLLVGKVLSPMQTLSRFLRDLVSKNPLEVEPPKKGIADFERLREDIEYCIDGLRSRQLRVEEAFVEVAIDLAREYEGQRGWDRGHGQRTRRYAAWLAEKLDLTPRQLDAVEVAALCHDIGREGEHAPDQPGMSEHCEEDHPVLGAALFSAVPGFEDVAWFVRHHHENWDGSGYPAGLSGNEIPIGARILRIAEVFDAIVSGARGEPKTPVQALQTMCPEVGTSFDPALFACFEHQVRKHEASSSKPACDKVVALQASPENN
jgi:HD-GYP domain-containing protein (c-di-GMP phosphodiesterase class II)